MGWHVTFMNSLCIRRKHRYKCQWINLKQMSNDNVLFFGLFSVFLWKPMSSLRYPERGNARNVNQSTKERNLPKNNYKSLSTVR